MMMLSLTSPIFLQAPPVLPIDVTSIVAVFMGMLVILIPIAGLTARFALKPIAEAVARMREAQGSADQLSLLEQRLSLMEQQLGAIEEDVQRLDEKVEFDRRLEAAKEE